MNRVFPILLAALVIICPLRCVMGCAYSTGESERTASACCCPAPIQSDDEPESPNPLPNCPAKCLCSGAIVVDVFEAELADVWTALFDATRIKTVARCLYPTNLENFDFGEQYIFSGRSLRHLHMSLTI